MERKVRKGSLRIGFDTNGVNLLAMAILKSAIDDLQMPKRRDKEVDWLLNQSSGPLVSVADVCDLLGVRHMEIVKRLNMRTEMVIEKKERVIEELPEEEIQRLESWLERRGKVEYAEE